jgi:hypothetical protein
LPKYTFYLLPPFEVEENAAYRDLLQSIRIADAR